MEANINMQASFKINNDIKDNENLVVCFNIECGNQIYNLGDILNDTKIDFWKKDRDAIGVWKIKQLKK